MQKKHTEKNTQSLDQKRMVATDPEQESESPIVTTGTLGDFSMKQM